MVVTSSVLPAATDWMPTSWPTQRTKATPSLAMGSRSASCTVVPSIGTTSEPSSKTSLRTGTEDATDAGTVCRAWCTAKPTAKAAAAPSTASAATGRTSRCAPVHRRNLVPSPSGCFRRASTFSTTARSNTSSRFPGAADAAKTRAASISNAQSGQDAR